jgi:hypothetical protein
MYTVSGKAHEWYRRAHGEAPSAPLPSWCRVGLGEVLDGGGDGEESGGQRQAPADDSQRHAGVFGALHLAGVYGRNFNLKAKLKTLNEVHRM